MYNGQVKRFTLTLIMAFGAITASRLLISKAPKRAEPISLKSNKKAIIFDLGGVLTRTNMDAAMKELGTKNIASYSICDWRSPYSLRPTLYKLLHTLSDNTNEIIHDVYGEPIPFIFCEVLKGERCELETLKVVLDSIEKEQKHFCSKRESRLCKKVAEMMFDHELLVSLQEEVKEGVKLLEECLAQGHHVIIFSNYGKRAFEALRKKFPHIFAKIKEEDIIVSAHIGAAKPEPASYHKLIQRLKAIGITPAPSNCFFIDDQMVNIKAAHAHNITPIHIKNQKFKPVRKTLQEHQLLGKTA